MGLKSIGEITLQNGTTKKIFLHSGTMDFFCSPASNDIKPRHWRIAIDEKEEIVALDTLELEIISLKRDDKTGKKFSFTAYATFIGNGWDDGNLKEDETTMNIGELEGTITF